jgi:hypothetical protein
MKNSFNNRFERWRGGAALLSQIEGSLIGINQLRLSAAQPASFNLIARRHPG